MARGRRYRTEWPQAAEWQIAQLAAGSEKSSRPAPAIACTSVTLDRILEVRMVFLGNFRGVLIHLPQLTRNARPASLFHLSFSICQKIRDQPMTWGTILRGAGCNLHVFDAH